MKHLFNFIQFTQSARSFTVSGQFFKKSLSLLGVLGLSTVLGTHSSVHALGLASLSLGENTNSAADHGVFIQKLHPRVSVHHSCYQTENFSTLKSQWQEFGGQQSFSPKQSVNLSILTNQNPEVPSQESLQETLQEPLSLKSFNKDLHQSLVEALVLVSKKASISLNSDRNGLVIPKEYLSASLKPAFNKVLVTKPAALRVTKDANPPALSDSESKRIASALSVITLTPEGSGDADLFENNKTIEKQPNPSSKSIKVAKVDKKDVGLKTKGNHPEVLSDGVAMEAFTEDEEEEMLTQKLQDLLRPKLASANSPEHRRSGYPSSAQSHSDSNRLAYASIRPSRGIYGAGFYGGKVPLLSIPIQGAFISSRFGPRGGRNHNGTDFAASMGTPIYASASGQVISSGWLGGYGNMVLIDHGNGLATLYGHCSEILVTTGQKVAQGQAIAKVGNTGHSTGPHLHYEVLTNGVPNNPESFLFR